MLETGWDGVIKNKKIKSAFQIKAIACLIKDFKIGPADNDMVRCFIENTDWIDSYYKLRLFEEVMLGKDGSLHLPTLFCWQDWRRVINDICKKSQNKKPDILSEFIANYDPKQEYLSPDQLKQQWEKFFNQARYK